MAKYAEQDIVNHAAEKLKNVLKAPEWAVYVKTGMSRERPPSDENWWFYRAASILRYVNKLGPVGTAKLRTKYGGKKNRGVKTEHFYKGSGKVIRQILQDLEKEGLIKQEARGVHKGRIITPKGKGILFSGLPKEAKLEEKKAHGDV
ncbi:MAG: 40S ribosomal protein S19 [Nanoarchaeota archaeon]